MKQPFDVDFADKMEIRMGSPFNICKILFKDFVVPNFEPSGFQDIYAWNQDFKYLALVKWNINANNEPGFNIYVIDVLTKNIALYSDRIEGICKEINFLNDSIEYIVLKNEDGKNVQVKGVWHNPLFGIC